MRSDFFFVAQGELSILRPLPKLGLYIVIRIGEKAPLPLPNLEMSGRFLPVTLPFYFSVAQLM